MLFDPGEITYISNKKLSKNLNKIFKDLDKKNILDFGAGANKFYKFIKYKKYFLYDLEPKFSKHHKSTCNLIIERDYKNIDIKLDIVLINSVIQYINIKNLEELISYFYKKNVSHIVINDIPKSNRILEFFFIFFRNPNTSLLIYKNIFKNLFFQNYLENKFFFHKRTDLYNLSKNIGFNVNYYKNFYSNNTRYTLILSLDNLGL